MTLGILLALGCAFATQLGFLYKHRGANEAACVDVRRPLQSGASLFRSKWFAVGMSIALGAWLLHVAALAFAPLSVVQAVLSTGVVLLAESHVAVHTWPELRAVTLDVYVCNVGRDNTTRANALLATLIDLFEPVRVERHALERGAPAASAAAP